MDTGTVTYAPPPLFRANTYKVKRKPQIDESYRQREDRGLVRKQSRSSSLGERDMESPQLMLQQTQFFPQMAATTNMRSPYFEQSIKSHISRQMGTSTINSKLGSSQKTKNPSQKSTIQNRCGRALKSDVKLRIGQGRPVVSEFLAIGSEAATLESKGAKPKQAIRSKDQPSMTVHYKSKSTSKAETIKLQSTKKKRAKSQAPGPKVFLETEAERGWALQFQQGSPLLLENKIVFPDLVFQGFKLLPAYKDLHMKKALRQRQNEKRRAKAKEREMRKSKDFSEKTSLMFKSPPMANENMKSRSNKKEGKWAHLNQKSGDFSLMSSSLNSNALSTFHRQNKAIQITELYSASKKTQQNTKPTSPSEKLNPPEGPSRRQSLMRFNTQKEKKKLAETSPSKILSPSKAKELRPPDELKSDTQRGMLQLKRGKTQKGDKQLQTNPLIQENQQSANLQKISESCLEQLSIVESQDFYDSEISLGKNEKSPVRPKEESAPAYKRSTTEDKRMSATYNSSRLRIMKGEGRSKIPVQEHSPQVKSSKQLLPGKHMNKISKNQGITAAKKMTQLRQKDNFSIGTISEKKWCRRADDSQFSKNYQRVKSHLKRSLERDNSFAVSSQEGGISSYQASLEKKKMPLYLAASKPPPEKGMSKQESLSSFIISESQQFSKQSCSSPTKRKGDNRPSSKSKIQIIKEQEVSPGPDFRLSNLADKAPLDLVLEKEESDPSPIKPDVADFESKRRRGRETFVHDQRRYMIQIESQEEDLAMTSRIGTHRDAAEKQNYFQEPVVAKKGASSHQFEDSLLDQTSTFMQTDEKPSRETGPSSSQRPTIKLSGQSKIVTDQGLFIPTYESVRRANNQRAVPEVPAPYQQQQSMAKKFIQSRLSRGQSRQSSQTRKQINCPVKICSRDGSKSRGYQRTMENFNPGRRQPVVTTSKKILRQSKSIANSMLAQSMESKFLAEGAAYAGVSQIIVVQNNNQRRHARNMNFPVLNPEKGIGCLHHLSQEVKQAKTARHSKINAKNEGSAVDQHPLDDGLENQLSEYRMTSEFSNLKKTQQQFYRNAPSQAGNFSPVKKFKIRKQNNLEKTLSMGDSLNEAYADSTSKRRQRNRDNEESPSSGFVLPQVQFKHSKTLKKERLNDENVDPGFEGPTIKFKVDDANKSLRDSSGGRLEMGPVASSHAILGNKIKPEMAAAASGHKKAPKRTLEQQLQDKNKVMKQLIKSIYSQNQVPLPLQREQPGTVQKPATSKLQMVTPAKERRDKLPEPQYPKHVLCGVNDRNVQKRALRPQQLQPLDRSKHKSYFPAGISYDKTGGTSGENSGAASKGIVQRQSEMAAKPKMFDILYSGSKQQNSRKIVKIQQIYEQKQLQKHFAVAQELDIRESRLEEEVNRASEHFQGSAQSFNADENLSARSGQRQIPSLPRKMIRQHPSMMGQGTSTTATSAQKESESRLGGTRRDMKEQELLQYQQNAQAIKAQAYNLQCGRHLPS